MAKTKIEKIAGIEEEIRQLENKRRQLVQAQKAQERKDRTKRLCKRMGLFESLLPESISLTDEQFQIFLEKTVLTEQSRRIHRDFFRAPKRHRALHDLMQLPFQFFDIMLHLTPPECICKAGRRR